MWGPVPGLSIEAGESADLEKCSCCNGRSKAVWGYVSKNGAAHAAYYVVWTENHLDKGVKVLVSIGQWGEGSRADLRKLFAMDCRMQNERPSFMLIDASKIQLDEEGTFGRGLTREEALEDPSKSDAFMTADHLSFCDQRVKNFLLQNKQ